MVDSLSTKNPREDAFDRVVLSAVSTIGATEFYKSLSRVCSKIAMKTGVIPMDDLHRIEPRVPAYGPGSVTDASTYKQE